jgi:hypothetical protein
LCNPPPLLGPGLVAAIRPFKLAWNEFLLPLTAPIKLSVMVVSDQYIWGQLMARAVLASILVGTFYFLGQCCVVEGLAAGAVEGREEYGRHAMEFLPELWCGDHTQLISSVVSGALVSLPLTSQRSQPRLPARSFHRYYPS